MVVYIAASWSGHSPGRLQVHDHVGDLPVLQTQRLLDLMGDGVAFFNGGVGRDLHVQVHIHARLRPPGADGVATDHARHGAGHGGDVVRRQARGVAEWRRSYGRGTSPTRSRTLASVRAAMASARSAPVLSTSSVKLLSASSSRMRAWMGARASTTTSPRSALRSA